MESAAQAINHAHKLYTRSGVAAPGERPPAFKAIGIGLAVGSGAFIGTSFVLKKVGLLKANEKYNEVAGEGYGYLKNFYWWAGMTLMILGEGLNFAAYAFTDAILVTPLGALSVVITTILSAIFLKERLSMVGKVACFLCIVGSVVIVMNAPENSSVATIQEMQGFVIHPAFLTYAGVIIVGSAIVAFWLGPKYGNKNMLVYISICSWVGGLSVVATQGLGAAIIAQAGGTPQFNQWFLYVLLVFVIATLLTEIIYLNKALNLFNAALVTPTYYVYFTSTTIITSAVLFRGFKGTPTSIITVINGFLTICSGVVLLQLSKSAKDVPDATVFAGDLDQIHTIAEQPQPETEPKADAIRGAAAIVRRLSSARQKMELEELKRLREEKMQESLESVDENGVPKYEWDGIRRRRTGTFSTARTGTFSTHRSIKSPAPTSLAPPTPHPPLGWSHFPTEEELAEANRPLSPALSSIVGTIRTRARSVLLPGHPDFRKGADAPKVQSPMHPVQLTSIAVAGPKPGEPEEYRSPVTGEEVSGSAQHVQFADSAALAPPTPPLHSARRQFSFQNMFKRNQSPAHRADGPSNHRRHRVSSRGYSSPQIRGATEEETLGLVKGDSHASRSMPALSGGAQYDDSDDEDDYDKYYHVEEHEFRDHQQPAARLYGHSITKGYNTSPPRKGGGGSDEKGLGEKEMPEHEKYRQRLRDRRRSESGNREDEDNDKDKNKPLPKLPPLPFGGKNSPAFT
ncbi:magnesium transporter NIPA-domain-containing protein [Achaetomium macrosporum]|uniref:Magnesium transporter NIPA-domain-containing protein n=1 Tax=Achaetomium macrosporum TaxID=79813 RepID=A0AAN7CED0_9PEZI|nr:magnesium transporter NIPA-domain-containing protein [Achaetomium macrosporum]